MVPLLIAVPVGTMLAWKRGDLAGVLGRLKAALAITAAALLAQLVLTRGADVLAACAMALALWVVAGSLIELASRVQLLGIPLERSWQRAKGLPRSSYAMTMAHVGLGVFVAGVTASSAWQSEAILVMQPGDRAALAGYDFTLARIDEAEGPNYVARRATFEVSADGAPVATLNPEKRFYPVERQATSEAGIDMGFFRDLYVVLGDPVEGAEAGAGHTVRIYHNPLVMWIWGGVIIMGFAGVLSLSDRRSGSARQDPPSPWRHTPAPSSAAPTSMTPAAAHRPVCPRRKRGLPAQAQDSPGDTHYKLCG
jgi:cytochrome c-type biogenesis protein CcmF